MGTYCVCESNTLCLSCGESRDKCVGNRRRSTIADLKAYSTSSAEEGQFSKSDAAGGMRKEKPCDIIFATGEKMKRGMYPYRNLNLVFNSFRIKLGRPSDFIGTEHKVGYLVVKD